MVDLEHKEQLNEILQQINGLFVGQLNCNELEAFNEMVELGIAYRSYEGVAGLMGCAIIKQKRKEN